jgi:UDP-N-acetylmuramate dehydrogenase
LKVDKSIHLKNLTTMQLGGQALEYVDVYSTKQLVEACKYAKVKKLSIFILGGGSNLIGRDEGFSGLVIHIKIPGIEITDIHAKDHTHFRVGAGVNWDRFVKISVEKNLSGIEAMSWIPGTVGASPVQNIGAYGQEVKDTIESVEVYDIEKDKFEILTNRHCKFKYRDSIFRGEAYGKYVIVYVNFKLNKNTPKPPFYKAIEDYFAKHEIDDYSVKNIRDAVIEIRRDKLPDPTLLPNSGSFFKNAICSKKKLADIQKNYPDVPFFEYSKNEVKIPTGWLIEQTGLKGKTFYGFKIHDKNALVLINSEKSSYKNLEKVRDIVKASVRNRFGIIVEQEPLEISSK